MKMPKELKSAIADDAATYVVGLAIPPLLSIAGRAIAAPLPVSTLRWAIQKLSGLRRTDYVDWNLPDWPIRYCEEAKNALRLTYRGKVHVLPQTLLHENPASLPLANYNLKFAYCDDLFALAPEIEALTEKPFGTILERIRRRKTFYDEQTLRLTGIIEEGNGLTLQVQPVSYVTYIRTNLLLDCAKDGRPTLRETVHASRRLEALDGSLLANSLGVNVLVFTADGSLVIQKRSRKVHIRPGELAPTGSGAMTRLDAETSGSERIRAVTLMREVTEETGIPVESLKQDSLLYLGLTRELIRGGKPEMFFCAQSTLSENQVRELWRRAHDRHESREIQTHYLGPIAFQPIDTAHQMSCLVAAVDALMDTLWEGASIPLKTAIALWLRQKVKRFDVRPG